MLYYGYMARIGERFGRLTIIGLGRRYSEWNRYGMVECRCRCECGREVVVLWKNLASGRTRSCGCMRKGIHSKVDEETKEKIRADRASGMSYDRIGKRYGLSKGSIYEICREHRQ